ncbi:MAG: hypothetical protein AB7O59_12695 [Pirellulales bacterium]
MVSRTLALTLVALCSLLSISPRASAQDEAAEKPAAAPSLSDRLEQFRQDLLGQPGQAERRAAADRKDLAKEITTERARRPARTGGSPTANRTAPQQPRAMAPAARAAATPQPPTPNAGPNPAMQAPTAVRTPARMEVQSARRAQPSKGLIPAHTPPERDVAPQTSPEPAVEQIAETPETPTEAQPQPTEAADEPAPSRVDIEEMADATRAPRVARAPRGAVAPKEQEPTLAAEPEAETQGVREDATFTSQAPVLSVEAVGPRRVRVGEQAQFVVRIRNSGAAASNVVVSMNVPEHAELASSHATSGTVPAPAADKPHGPLEWKITRLEGRSVETLNLTLVPRKSEPLDLAVRFTYAPEASQLLVEVQEPKLEMNVSGATDVMFGETKIYKLILSNPGNGDAENVVIGLLPVGRGAEGIASHKLGTLHAGETKTIDVELTARQAGSIAIKAQAYADGGLRVEAVAQVTVRRANLQVEVQSPRVTFAGTVGTYRIKVVNSGDAPAEAVEVAAMLPPDAKFIASTGGGRFDAQQGKVNWSAGSVPPNSERELEMQCTLATPGDNRMQFVATAADELSASATSETKVQALADLKIEVRDPQGPIAVGGDAVYEVVLRNRGSAPAENVEVVVFFSEGLEAMSVEGGAHEITTGQVAFKPIATVGAGESVVFRVHAKADRSGHHVFRTELVCQSLGTKLAAEEATFFYGDGDTAAAPADAAADQQNAAGSVEPQPHVAEGGEAAAADSAPPVPE